MSNLNRASRARLNRHTQRLFTGETLFDRVARAVCKAECLPRKELYESWEMARRVRRRLRGGRIVELGAGHGLLAMLMLILDDTSPTAVCVDIAQPASFTKVQAVITDAWPRLAGRLSYQVGDVREVGVTKEDLVISAHACGTLTDTVIDLAVSGNARLALLPCCHDLERCDTGGWEAWTSGPLAVDTRRAMRLEQAGYDLSLTTIPDDITPQNRLIIATPQRTGDAR